MDNLLEQTLSKLSELIKLSQFEEVEKISIQIIHHFTPIYTYLHVKKGINPF
jgi:hypothetical protein